MGSGGVDCMDQGLRCPDEASRCGSWGWVVWGFVMLTEEIDEISASSGSSGGRRLRFWFILKRSGRISSAPFDGCSTRNCSISFVR